MKSISDKDWATLTPVEKWQSIPDVSYVLDWCKWFAHGIENSHIIADDETIKCLYRIDGFLWRVIEMLEGEKHHVRGTTPLPRFDISKTWVKYLRDIVRMDQEGKFSPESRPFLARNLRSVAESLQKKINQLEG